MDNRTDQAEKPSKTPGFLQFSVRELLSLVTIVAVACSLVRWLGPIAIAFLYVVVGPISAIVFLITRRKRPADEMMLFCGAATGLTWAALQLYFAVSADEPAGVGGPWPVHYVLMPVLLGLFGAHAGMISGAIFLYLDASRRPPPPGRRQP